MHASSLIPAIAIVFACAVSVAVEAAQPTHGMHATCPSGAVVFTRPQFKADGTLRSSSLWLTDTDGRPLRSLTPIVDGQYDGAGSWSPGGHHVAYQHASANTGASDHFDIQIVAPHTGQLRQLTSGAGNFVTPVWGPGNRIAFVSKYGDKDCLSVADPYALLRQRDLFCPPSPAQVMRPMWSANGDSLYIHAGYYIGGVDPYWRSLVYRVDATTGAASALFDEVLEEPRHLEFAPDGTRGIYSNDRASAAGMTMVAFATGSLTPIGYGYAPRWSKDSRRIAFTGEVYEFDDPADVRYYGPLYVMDADGANLRRITRARVNNHAYTAADWSDDGVHLLVNRRIYLDPSLTITRYAMRIVNTDTRTITPVAAGYAAPGAWREP